MSGDFATAVGFISYLDPIRIYERASWKFNIRCKKLPKEIIEISQEIFIKISKKVE